MGNSPLNWKLWNARLEGPSRHHCRSTLRSRGHATLLSPSSVVTTSIRSTAGSGQLNELGAPTPKGPRPRRLGLLGPRFAAPAPNEVPLHLAVS